MHVRPGPHGKKPRIVLLATVGTSPAVLTETVWALAHPKKGGERIVPDQIVVVTTRDGRAKIQEQLLGAERGRSDGWARLLAAFRKERIPIDGKLKFGASDSIRVLSSPDGTSDIDDLRSAEENLEAANFLLGEIGKYANTKSGSVQLFASIAGGRKTMGALTLSCMSLLGREQDHVLHVLVDDPFDKPWLDPVFLFPENRSRQDPRTGRVVRDKDANLSLIDLPFVKMHKLYEKRFGSGLLPSYRELVEETQEALAEVRTRLRFDMSKGALFVDDAPVRLAPTEFAALSLDLLHAPDNLLSALPAAHDVARKDHRYGWLQDFGDNPRFSSTEALQNRDDLTKVRNQIRTKLKRIAALEEKVFSLVPRGADHSTYPMSLISADIPDFWKRAGV